jgi:dienelactone hydrolase
MTLDVYRPAGTTEKLPAAVFIHGDLAQPDLVRDIKDWGQYRSWVELTASTGIAAVTFNPRSAHQGTRMRDVTEDIEAALNSIDSAGQQLGIDASRLAPVAFSMGVPYALRVAFNRRLRLRCVVAFYGPLDLSDAHWPVSAEVLREFSPFHHLRQGTDLPPLLVARAGADDQLLNQSIDRFVAETLQRNIEIDVLNHPRAPHGFDLGDPSSRSRQIIAAALAFLGYHLGPR